MEKSNPPVRVTLVLLIDCSSDFSIVWLKLVKMIDELLGSCTVNILIFNYGSSAASDAKEQELHEYSLNIEKSYRL